jgi:hypothetical protein
MHSKWKKKMKVLPAETGSALSFALRLKKRNRGASHTQIPKNEAISVNPGTVGAGPL